MNTPEDKETRYFIELDLHTRKILNWDCDQRKNLVPQELKEPGQVRIYITRGQYNKLEKKWAEETGTSRN